jgi:hypothetical protein
MSTHSGVTSHADHLCWLLLDRRCWKSNIKRIRCCDGGADGIQCRYCRSNEIMVSEQPSWSSLVNASILHTNGSSVNGGSSNCYQQACYRG